MTINRELFAKIHDQITKHPETHDQLTFEWCGTTRCVAGWALAFSALEGEKLFDTANRLYGDPYPDIGIGLLGIAATRLLGLTGDEAEELFYNADNEEAVRLVKLYATRGREWKDEK